VLTYGRIVRRGERAENTEKGKEGIGYAMSTEDFEIAEYFRGLLDHEAGCRTVGCANCGALERIVEAVRERLFGSTTYRIEGSPTVEQEPPAELVRFAVRRRTHSVR